MTVDNNTETFNQKKGTKKWKMENEASRNKGGNDPRRNKNYKVLQSNPCKER